MQFDLPKEQSSIIKVIGVGGGGSNAVNHMFEQGIRGVNFVIGNTDAQAMELSAIPNKIQLGPSLTGGLGAGSNPEIGRKATEESFEDIRDILEKNTKMVFITAGMGGGTGTGGAPVIAKLAKEMGILTVGIVTTPFFFEGRRKMKQAEQGIEELRNNVDSIIVISNDKIREIYGNLTRSDAFARADDILAIAARSISEIITVPGQINVDFADVEYVMHDSGVAIMGAAVAEGEDRAARAVQSALASPLLNDNTIKGAQKILLNITSGTEQEMLIDEITEIHEYVLEEAGQDTDVIFGTCDDENMGDKLSVTIIATGFQENRNLTDQQSSTSNKVVHQLNDVIERKREQQPTQPKPTQETEQQERHTLTFDFDVSGSSDEPEENEEAAPEPQRQEPEPEESKDQEQYFEFRLNQNTEPPAEDTPEPEETQEHAEEEKNEPPTDSQPKAEPKTEEQEEPPFIISRRQEEQQEEEEPSAPKEDRIKRLRNLNLKLNNPQSLTELENEPAFKRRNIQLSSTPHSSESNYSRYTLSEGEDDDEDNTEIKKNNSFLHDNVD